MGERKKERGVETNTSQNFMIILYVEANGGAQRKNGKNIEMMMMIIIIRRKVEICSSEKVTALIIPSIS